MTDKRNKALFIRVTEEMIDRLDGAAEKMKEKLGFRMNRTDLIRGLISKGLERVEKDGEL
jgi:hypothetical protein